VNEAETGKRLQELLTRLDATLAELEQADDSEQAVDRLSQMAELAREVQAEIDRLRRETPDAPA
jgi:primosomal protein N''